jgi:glycosyltransferase involved in cell wall biosynthesis
MQSKEKVVCLSNVYDQHYHDLRAEEIARTLSGSKRQVLFRCLAAAAGRELMVLSSPPKAAGRRSAKWLPPLETDYAGFRQFFCGNWDAPKLRIPLSWFFYARHVMRHVRSGDLVLIDNYEFIYIVAAWGLKLFRRVTFILDYEDGKHLIDRSWDRIFSGLAEWAGRPLIRAALLAHPAMGKRLPSTVPTEVVPGFIPQPLQIVTRSPGPVVRFLYSGSLDRTRGVDLLLEALSGLPEQGWRLDITGAGPLADHVARFVEDNRWLDRVKFHHSLPPKAYDELLAAAHVGLNCQRFSDPISEVTFPSKVFTYLSAGLLVISSRASAVEELCGKACCYYSGETPESLANTMKTVMSDFPTACRQLDLAAVSGQYSVEATTTRLRRLFQGIGIIRP